MDNTNLLLQIRKALLKDDFIVCIVTDNKELEWLKSHIPFFVDEVQIITIPSWGIEPYSRLSPSSMVSGERVKSIVQLSQFRMQHLADRVHDRSKVIVLTTVESIIQKIPPAKPLADRVLKLICGKKYDRDSVIKILLEGGYQRSSIAESCGEFAVRGGIIDVVTYDDAGYRIDFLYSTIDKIKVFDPTTQLTTAAINSVTIYPISEIILHQDYIDIFQKKYLSAFGIKNDLLYQETLKGIKYIGAEHWLNFFYDNLESITDYISSDAIIIQPPSVNWHLRHFYESINTYYDTRLKNHDSSYHSAPPSMLYNDEASLLTFLASFQITQEECCTPLLIPQLFDSKNLQIDKVYVLLEYQQKKNYKNLCMMMHSQGAAQRLLHLLKEADIQALIIENISQIYQKHHDNYVYIAIIADHGASFCYDGTIFFREKDLSHQHPVIRSKKNTVALHHQFFQDLMSVEVGDLLVHSQFGIGQFQGLKTINVQEHIRDFIEILYADNDKLYIPIENLDIISRYGSHDGNVALDKLGGLSWQSKKGKLEEKIKDVADNLMKIAAEREITIATQLTPIAAIYQKFCDEFPYITTDDQEDAINIVIEDLQSGKPMDRLICADVGFGKTEVALRAACIATLGEEPVQVALIVPTTLLARQHYAVFCARFKDFPVTINQLSKFTPTKDIAGIKDGIKNGEVNIVIGTHSLLGKDIAFQNLGLVIIDEEQHFGVLQKEKLKKLQKNCHVLTLSATPIPRTLQTALSNIKSLSLITTPPINRKPVKTYVLPYDAMTIRNALLKEKQRNGLSFYVTPKISYLDELEKQLSVLVPELKVTKAHGALTPMQLDQIMNDFYDHKFDVLLSTSIVESGLDIMNANTMIIDRAHMFGLAQLYQMRGRVGRGPLTAYAYLTTPKLYLLAHAAKKRLNIMQSLQTLGVGFSIASHDMDNRGYGNLIGEAQSGHIRDIGVELYHKMLSKVLESIDHNGATSNDWSPILNIGIAIQIPETYIADINLRIKLYRQISSIEDENECEKFAADMIDRFGQLPIETENLFTVIKIKILAKNAGVSKIEVGHNGFVFSVMKEEFINALQIIDMINAEKEFDIKIKTDNKIAFLLRHEKQSYDRIKAIKKFLHQCIEYKNVT